MGGGKFGGKDSGRRGSSTGASTVGEERRDRWGAERSVCKQLVSPARACKF
jgi:hypothetical protein